MPVPEPVCVLEREDYPRAGAGPPSLAAACEKLRAEGEGVAGAGQGTRCSPRAPVVESVFGARGPGRRPGGAIVRPPWDVLVRRPTGSGPSSLRSLSADGGAESLP